MSFSLRLVLLNGWSARHLSRYLGIARATSADWRLPGGLEKYASRFGAHVGLPEARDWAIQLTLAPYYASTLPEGSEAAFTRRMVENGFGPKRPVAAFGLEEWFVATPRICPSCVEVAEAALGFSTVQRDWLLPYATRCAIHGDVLMAEPKWAPVGHADRKPISTLPGRRDQALLSVRQWSSLLAYPAKEMDRLADLLQSRGFTGPKGKIRRTALNQLLLDFSRNRYEHPELDALTSTANGVAKMTRALGQRNAALHPLACNLLIQALESRSAIAPTLKWDKHPGEKLAALRNALAEGLSPTAAAGKAGVAVTTAVVHYEAMGFRVTHKPKRVTRALREQIRLALEGHARVEDVAERLDVSLSTVYRTLKSSPALQLALRARQSLAALQRRKEEWIAIASSSPGATITQLRAMAPATYAAIQRRAPDFLKSLSYADAPPTRKTRTARTPAGADQAFARRIALTQTAVATDAGRQSLHGIALAAGRKSPGAAKQAMPTSSEALSRSVETKAEFIRRRLDQGAKKLLETSAPLVPWRVVKAAALRAESVEQAGVDPADLIAMNLAAMLKKQA